MGGEHVAPFEYVVWQAPRWQRPLRRLLRRPTRRGFRTTVVVGEARRVGDDVTFELRPVLPLEKFEDRS